MKTSWRMTLQISAIALASALAVGAAHAGEAEAKKWISSEFQPSTLSQDKQMAEMKWFIDASQAQGQGRDRDPRCVGNARHTRV